MEVGALTFILGRAGTAYPIHGFAARAGLGDDAFSGMPAPQTCDFHALDLLIRQVWNIHIEQPGCLRGLLPLMQQLHGSRQLHHQLTGTTGCHLNVRPAFFGLRESQSGDAEEITLHGRAHRAGVNRVVAHVGAVVDTRNHQVRPVTEQAGQRDVHTVRRRAIDETKAVGSGMHVQGGMQGQRIAFGAVVDLRCHNLHICNRFEGFIQGDDPRGLVAVVVANENFHD